MLSGLSYNIYHGRNLDQITAWLNNLPQSFDILCFQEFPHAYIPYLQDHLKPFHYDFHYATSFKHGEDDYGELTLTDRTKLEVVAHSIVPLGTSFIEEQLLKLQSGRSALLTKLRYEKKSFLLVNTHLLAYASNQKRREQLAVVMRAVKDYLEKETMPVVVLGDMNYTSLLNRDRLFNLIR
ncbi:MAG: endonuclease/exonuclease/phosphatase family protein, partial [Candidatus Levybacteria bacterium]|nr:endonuclease/exonuclease/phosphatase family protein [Candidatus Levybacteria bacterium]